MGLMEPGGDEKGYGSGDRDLGIWSEAGLKAIVDGGEVKHRKNKRSRGASFHISIAPGPDVL